MSAKKNGPEPKARGSAKRVATGSGLRAQGLGKAQASTRAGTPFIVLTGLSGSGKSQAIRALEDLGYFCVDNLPVALLPMLAELTLREIGRAHV